METIKTHCGICNLERDNPVFRVREMMFGSRQVYDYFQCRHCECLQIREFPADLTPHYPDTYYSKAFTSKAQKGVKAVLRNKRNRYALYQRGFLGWVLQRIRPNRSLQSLHPLSLPKDADILDVGCGAGELLCDLADLGFTSLTGVDPFIDDSIRYSNGVQVIKSILSEFTGEFDVIMFHHSLEHIQDQNSTLQAVKKLLKSNGVCLIRIPIVPSHGWDQYGVNWVHLDAPRHFFLHSEKSVQTLAGSTDFEVSLIQRMDNDFSLWASEQYVRDIPLTDQNSLVVSRKHSVFSVWDLLKYRLQSIKLNKKGKSDVANIVLKPKGNTL